MADTERINAGPTAWRNWQSHSAGIESDRRYESAFYCDTTFTGDQVQAGPYLLINTIAHGSQEDGPAIVLRTDWFLEWDVDASINETDDSRYVGGTADDEVASLLALALGTRVRAGGRVREWRNEDPLGRPVEYDRHPSRPPRAPGPAVVPCLSEPRNLESAAALLGGYGVIDPGKAVRLARSARLYSSAIWIADADPNMAWLLLVSAVETAASTTDARRGATRRFCDFLAERAPDPPPVRAPWSTVDWTRLGELAASIYDMRSRALHDGRPFPDPMLRAPRWETNLENDLDEGASAGYIERPDGIAQFSHDAVWSSADMPMLLWVFEYIVRGSLQGWWLDLSRA